MLGFPEINILGKDLTIVTKLCKFLTSRQTSLHRVILDGMESPTFTPAPRWVRVGNPCFQSILAIVLVGIIVEEGWTLCYCIFKYRMVKTRDLTRLGIRYRYRWSNHLCSMKWSDSCTHFSLSKDVNDKFSWSICLHPLLAATCKEDNVGFFDIVKS